jgi:hypothetical protein
MGTETRSLSKWDYNPGKEQHIEKVIRAIDDSTNGIKWNQMESNGKRRNGTERIGTERNQMESS